MKETIEEASENHQKGGYEWQNEKRKSFTAGAKSDAARDYWFEKFQEQDKNKFSEEEVLDILYQWSMYKIDIELKRLADELPNILPYNEWFSQFKKTNNGK
jgi:hypothetical protein